jgi:N4-gp56 family major capsid protein
MGNTGSISAMRERILQREVLIGAIEEMYLSKFMGAYNTAKGSNSPIVLKTDFTKKKGEFIRMKFVPKLSGEGRDGDDDMEGNEESFNQYTDDVYINQKRNAVRLQGDMDEQKEATDMRKTARSLIGTWLAEIVEKELFRKAGGVVAYTFSNTPTAPSSNRVIYGGNATADTDIDSGDKMTLALLFKISNKIPTMTPIIKPVRVNGKSYFLMLIHPRQRYDLMQDADYLTLQKDAGVRGLQNPLFSGADAVVDNLIIHTHNYVPTFSTWGSGLDQPGARALVMGAQGLAVAVGRGAHWVEKEFDYKNKWAICCGRIFGCQKLVFNSEDFAIVSVDTYATSI